MILATDTRLILDKQVEKKQPCEVLSRSDQRNRRVETVQVPEC